jgi:hypothetical protein
MNRTSTPHVIPTATPRFQGNPALQTATRLWERYWGSMLAKQLTAVALPAGFLTWQHVSWMQRPESKRAMLIQMGTFWVSALAGIYAFHRPPPALKKALSPATYTAVRYLGAGLMPVLGFLGGQQLALRLSPQHRGIDYSRPQHQARTLTPQAALPSAIPLQPTLATYRGFNSLG